MRGVGGAAVVCALLAPILVIGGSALAAARQPAGYDPVRQTLSTLSALGATDRWIMASTLVLAGVAYLVVAIGLTGVPPAARLVLAAAGLAVGLAGMFPQPAGGMSVMHMGSAGIGWVALTVWPLVVCAAPAQPGLPGRRATWIFTAVLLGLVGWFFVQLLVDGRALGLAERILVVAQTLWPAAVGLALRARTARVPAAAVAPIVDRMAD